MNSSSLFGCFRLFLVMIVTGLLGLATLGQVQAHTLPKATGYVTDLANILSVQEKEVLESQLAAAAAATNGAEVAVVILPSIDDTIENEAQHIFDDWKIGKAELDNGVLFLVAIEQRQVRIHTGYGAETVLTDATAGRILRSSVVPEFKAGNYAAGITAGVSQILFYLNNPELANSLPQEEELSSSNGDWQWVAIIAYFVFSIGISLLTYIIAFLGRSKSWWTGGAAGAILGALVAQWWGFLIFGLLGLILDYVLSKNYQRWSLEHKTTSWKKTWGGFSSSSSSSSSHSFGGGSSGGGGSSSSW